MIKRKHEQTFLSAETMQWMLQENNNVEDLTDMLGTLSFNDQNSEEIMRDMQAKHALTRVQPSKARYEEVKQQLDRGQVPRVLPVEDEGWMPANEFGVVYKRPFKLYEHQAQGVAWALHREENPVHGIRAGVFAVKMGLGKSLMSQTIIMSGWKPGQCATLVVMPKTLLTNYMLDISKFFGDTMTALVWERDILEERFLLFTSQTPYKNHCVVVSYDTVLALAKALGITRSKGKGNTKLTGVAQAFFDTPWHRVIMDESHKFSNHKSLLWESLSKLKPGRRLCLTGTAVKNYEDELFAQFVICGMNILPDHRQWTIQNYRKYNLREAVFARDISDCAMKLPEKQEVRHPVVLSAPEKAVYNILMRTSSNMLDAFKAKQSSFATVLEMFTRLRQTCIAPHLITPGSKTKKLTAKEKTRLADGVLLGQAHVDLERQVRNPEGPMGYQSSKMRELVRIARSIPPDEKMLVFAEWTSACRLAQTALARAFGDKAVECVDGETQNRDQVFSRFKIDPEVRFLVCTSVATHGLTLTEANHALSLSTMWNSTTNEQFYARIWRIGQTKKCYMWQLIVQGSIESKMLEICETKHNIRDLLLEKGLNSETIGAFLGQEMA